MNLDALIHDHKFDKRIFCVENYYGSKDELFHCSCGAVRHVYTYDPGKIRYEWTYVPPAQS